MGGDLMALGGCVDGLGGAKCSPIRSFEGGEG